MLFIWIGLAVCVAGIFGLITGNVGPVLGRGKAGLMLLAGFLIYFMSLGMLGSADAKANTAEAPSPVIPKTAAKAPAPPAEQKAPPAEPVATKAPPAPPAPKAPAPEPAAKPEDWFASVVNAEADPTTNLPDKRSRLLRNGIEIQATSDGGMMVTIRAWADDNLSRNLIRAGILSDSTKIFKRIFTERPYGPDKVLIQWYIPGEDAKGNSVDLQLVTVALTKTNAAGFNWANFRYANLPEAADQYDEHPGLNQ